MNPEHISIRSLAVAALALMAIGIALTMCTQKARARDAGQWESSDPAIRDWYQGLRQPDNPGIPCCGTADAYYADRLEVEGDVVYAVITDTRDDAPLGRSHIAPGTRFAVPAQKMKRDGGNPTGHNVIFIGMNATVYCFVTGTLS